MNKIKLTQKQAQAIEYALCDLGGYTHERLIKSHSSGGIWASANLEALNDLDVLTLVDALRIGYEIEEKETTDKEKLDFVVQHWFPDVQEVCEEVDGEWITWLIEQTREYQMKQDYLSVTFDKLDTLQEFLQDRSIDTSYWGGHIIDVIIDLVKQQDDIILDQIKELEDYEKQIEDLKINTKLDTSNFFNTEAANDFKAMWKTLSDELGKSETWK